MSIRTRKTKWRVILVSQSILGAKEWKTLGWVWGNGEQDALNNANDQYGGSTYLIGGRIQVISINVNVHDIDDIIY